MSDARFTITGVDADAADPLGLWSTVPDVVSFGAGTEAEPEEPLWRVTLPADPAAASAELKERRAALAATRVGLARAGEKMAQLRPAGPEVAFAVGEPPLPAEQRLLDSLAYLREEQAMTSFGLGLPRLPEGWSESVAELKDFLGRAGELVRPRLRVETVVGDRPVALTRMTLDGDQETVWIALESGSLHLDALSVALETRRALLALLAKTMGGAVLLAGRFSVPGGVIMALPAAYRFVRDIIDDVKAVNAMA